MQLLSKLLLAWTRLFYILILAKIILHIAVFECSQIYLKLGLGGGLVVSVLAFDSNDPSLNSTKVYNFFWKSHFVSKTAVGVHFRQLLDKMLPFYSIIWSHRSQTNEILPKLISYSRRNILKAF